MLNDHRWSRHTRNLQRHLDLLTGAERAYFAIDDSMDSTIAHTASGGHITFNPRYLDAILTAIADLDPNESARVRSSRESCILAELSGTVIHELAHVAYQGEAFAYLVDYYWRSFYPTTFLPRGSIQLEQCCGKNRPSSWYPSGYPERRREDAVRAAVCWSSIVARTPQDLRTEWENCGRGENCG